MPDNAAQPIAVLGGGSWGTALAILLASTGRPVQLWARKRSHRQEMADTRQNQRYLPGYTFPDSLQIDPDAEIEALAKTHNTFLLVVPSHAFRATTERLYQATQAAEEAAVGKAANPLTILWGTKGFDPESGQLLGEVIKEVFGPQVNAAIISGPSFATETAGGLPTALTAAAPQIELAETVAEWFRTPSTRVYTNTDITGVQLGGAIKNVIAVAAGISDGLGFGANARAALITRGLAELTRLGLAMGGKLETFMGLAGMGDLILTCTDNQSRNRRFGLGIGQGQSVDDTIQSIGQEVEGYHTTRELYKRARMLDITMPITEQVYHVLYQGRDPKVAVQALLHRDPKSE